MEDVDAVLARISNDARFREAMHVDPRSALEPWSLSTDDLARIQVDLDRLSPTDPLDVAPTVRSLLGAGSPSPTVADETEAL
jgi:hypothetical protein